MQKLSLGIIVLSLMLTGCDETKKLSTSNHGGPPVPSVSQQSSKQWVVFSSTRKPEPEYYVLTNEKVTNVGKSFFDFHGTDIISQGPAGWATNDTDAMKLYAIPGLDTKTAVAVQLKDGTYIRANAVGNKQP
jgi:hypothetical protein